MNSAADFGGKLGAENFAKIQKELNDFLEETNRHWIARANSEAEFASELMTKLTNARSIPDAAAVYQEWITQRMQRLAEDNQKIFSDSQKFLTACTKLAAGGVGGPST